MINTKETLKKLHKKFPLLSLDELFDILDCYVEENCLWPRDITWKNEPSPIPTVKTSSNTTNISCNKDMISNTLMAVRYDADGGPIAN